MPNADVSKFTGCALWPRDVRSFCDSAGGTKWRIRHRGSASAAARLRRDILRVACRAEARSEARLRVALRRYGGASFACIHERRLVDLTRIELVTS